MTTIPNGPGLNADGDGSASISNPPTVLCHEDTALTVVDPPAQIVAPMIAADATITAIAGFEMAVSNTPNLPALVPIIPPPDIPALGPTIPPLHYDNVSMDVGLIGNDVHDMSVPKAVDPISMLTSGLAKEGFHLKIRGLLVVALYF